ncbi:hypothetical protein EMPS_08417 [Entomortierella parvispora]|uniref:Fe2OG dioxygenase domain-containing protein n=1 Tax=Entomortierella parvispora TaxID=205924 RepID=A0A9P3LZD5_9FUNG|nr:hypothetical protein EMPS_08417 [Entomortierella parvispora]
MDKPDDGAVSEELALAIESWPRLSAPGRQGSSISSWTTILGPSQVLVLPQFLPVQDTRALLDYLNHWMKLEIDDKLDPTQPRPKNVPRPGYAFRDNDRVQMDSPDFARMLWQKCGLADRWRELWMDPKSGLETTQGHCITSGARNNKRVRHAVGLNRNIRLYRYQNGQSFGAHYDESITDPEDGTVSEYTVLIYLNGEKDSDLTGGETVFYPKGKKNPVSATSSAKRGGATASKRGGAAKLETNKTFQSSSSPTASSSLSHELPNGGIAVKPDRGLLLVHRHGDECMLHEALIVQQGYKYVLRTDIMYEP